MAFEQRGPLSGTPTVVKNLLLINILVYVLKFTHLGDFGGVDMDTLFGLHFWTSPLFRPWQLVTHMFMHGGTLHLAMNMIGLFMLGAPLEYRWGAKRFLTYYMITGVGASLVYLGSLHLEYSRLMTALTFEQIDEVRTQGYGIYLEGKNYIDPAMAALNRLWITPMVGASGALFGVMLAFGMLYPNVELIVFPLPIPIKAKYFVIIYGGIELMFAFANRPGDSIAHFAHLGGMVFGYFLIRYWKRKDPFVDW